MERVAEKWPAEKAWDWYNRLPWLCGFNYLPSTVVNFVEFWRDETFDAATIEKELALAASIGFNACRVNLIYEVWAAERKALLNNLERFLGMAEANGMSTMLCFFDDCCLDGQQPIAGPQLPPVPGIGNSRQVGSPAHALIDDPNAWGGLEQYVSEFVTHFAEDKRVLCWDIYNEPGQSKLGNRSLPLLEASFGWVRKCRPVQPLTTGSWWENMVELNEASYRLSDIISFHTYSFLPVTMQIIEPLKQFGRPIICTEWMARTLGSRIETHLPYFKENKIACYQWGLVNGRTQTHLPWTSLKDQGDEWFHDIFHANGEPYRSEEIDVIRKMTQKSG